MASSPSGGSEGEDQGRRAAKGAGRPRSLHDHLADRRNRHFAQRRCRADRRGQLERAGHFHDRAMTSQKCRSTRTWPKRTSGVVAVDRRSISRWMLFPNGPSTARSCRCATRRITVQNVVTYDTVIGVSNPDLKLKPGMTANVSIVGAQRDNILKISNAALRYRPAMPLRTRLPRADRRSRRTSGATPGEHSDRADSLCPARFQAEPGANQDGDQRRDFYRSDWMD